MSAPTAATPAQLAEDLRSLLAPACARVAIAGSIRRGKPDPHDIEIVAECAGHGALETQLLNLQMTGALLLHAAHQRDRPRYKRRVYRDFPVDLFIVLPPAQWGLILLIRTGPAAFGQTALARWKRATNGGYSKDGCLYTANGTAQPPPDESDVFEALHLHPIPPNERTPERIHHAR